jgi:hypothetical protein
MAILLFLLPFLIVLVSALAFIICLIIFLKRLIFKQGDSDWWGRKGLLISIVTLIIAVNIIGFSIRNLS